jgi:type I restriction enzyme, R subunit
MLTANQNPEQLAHDKIDKLLPESGWLIQNKSSINLAASVGIAVREYQSNVGPSDYILFVNPKPFSGFISSFGFKYSFDRIFRPYNL